MGKSGVFSFTTKNLFLIGNKLKQKKMNLTNPAVTEGVNIFVNIIIILAAFAHALMFVNARKESQKKN